MTLGQEGVEVLSGQFPKILRLENEVEPGKPLMAYGLNSLSAVELRNWIRQKMGVEMTTLLDITKASSLITVSESNLLQPENAGKYIGYRLPFSTCTHGLLFSIMPYGTLRVLSSRWPAGKPGT